MAAQLKFTASVQHRYTNALHISYHDTLYATISALPAPDLKAWRIQALLPDWRQSIDMEIEISREAAASRDTKQLEELDAQRDRLITYIFTIIRAERTCGILPQRVEAGKHLSIITKTYNKLQSEAYKEQTAYTEGLLVDLKKRENFADLQTLGLDAYVGQLEQVNNDFKQRIRTRTVMQAQAKLPTAREQRKVSDASLATIQERIQGIFHFVDTEAERERINYLVTLINKVTDEHRARYNQATGQTAPKGKGGTNTGKPKTGGVWDEPAPWGRWPDGTPRADGE